MAYLEMHGITKVYRTKGIRANDRVNLSVDHNEIHAIVGENGAGKTTLMKILYGLEQADEGTILFKNLPVKIDDPIAATNLGIGMVHQHFKLIPDFSVTENVILGIEPRKNGFFIDKVAAGVKVKALIRENNFSIDHKTKVEQLTVGQMQQVEIIKMLYREAELLILDEPTSVLTEQEIGALFATLKKLQQKGKTIIIITHKLREVQEISDRVTVMRNGRIVAVRKTSEVDRRELTELMVGKSVLFDIDRPLNVCGDAVLELKGVTVLGHRQERPLLNQVSMSIRSCEIVGVAGVSGNGLDVLEDVIAGLRKVDSGKIFFSGENVTGLKTMSLRERGLAYVPSDRLSRGASLEVSVRDNMLISKRHDFIRGGIIRRKEVDEFVDKLLSQFSIDGTGGIEIGMLSGGNIQKVILARELSEKTHFILFSEPTWGLDVASSQFVYEKILELRKEGSGVLLISSNLDEVMGLSDTILVMYRGRIVGILRDEEKKDKNLIGEYMLGLRNDFENTVGKSGSAAGG